MKVQCKKKISAAVETSVTLSYKHVCFMLQHYKKIQNKFFEYKVTVSL